MFKQALAEGLKAHQTGDLARAGEYYRKALGLQPNNPDALNLMGVLMTQAGQMDVAINLLESAARLAPDFAPIHINLGNAYQAAGRLDDAIAAFTNAKMADISVTEAHLNLASALIAANRPDEALKSLDLVIKLAPNAPEGYNFKGNALASLGRLAEAGKAYEQAVDKKSDFFEGWANLGGIRRDLGDIEGALEALDKALALNPGHLQSLGVWVEAMIQVQRTGAAERRIIEAIGKNPNVAALHHILGIVRKMAGQPDGAVQPLESAIRLEPGNVYFSLTLSEVFTLLERWEEAQATLNRVLMLHPNLAAAYGALAELYYAQNRVADAIEALEQAAQRDPDTPAYGANLGAYLLNAGRTQEALEALNRTLKAHPNHASALNNRAAVLRKLGRIEDAIVDVRTALNAHPDDSETLTNLAALLEMTGQLNAAFDAATQALAISPDNAAAHSAMGIILKAQGDFVAARKHLEQAVELNPRLADANWSLGLLQLLQGDFDNGWWNYRWRWKLEHRPCPYLDRKLWDGGPLHGESILIHAEQGLGDAIQFIRYLPEVAQLGGQVVFSCHRPLVDLLTRAFRYNDAISIVCHDDVIPMTDWHAPLLALPYLFGTDLENIPDARGLIVAREHKRTALPPHPKGDSHPKIGLVWSGNPLQRNDRNRSAPLCVLAPLIENTDACFYSLQVGARKEDQALLASMTPHIVDLAPHIQDFNDTADLVDQLDVVISVCTSVAHLAGTMGKPTWVMLAHVPDFRWLLEREDCPWYPSARLFRQPTPNGWESVAAAIGDAIAARPAS